MAKLRILEVINSLNHRAGAEVFFTNLCVKLKQQKDVELAVLTIYPSVDISLQKQLIDNGIDVLTCDRNKKIDLKTSKKLKKIITDFKPDIINFHLSFYLFYFMTFGLKKKPWKLIKTYHSVPYEMNKIDKFIEKRYLEKGELHLIGISDIISDQINQLYNKKYESHTIYNGINLPNIPTFQASNKMYDFIIVASMTPVKNHILLFDVFAEFIIKFPNANLLCVGGGPLLEKNKEYVKRKGIDSNVVFTGSVDDVNKYLSQSKTLVLSSNYEGNPICVLEAMSHGLQIVAPRVGGIPDVVLDDNGYLYEVGNADELLKCLLKAYEGERYDIISKNNLERIKLFSIEHCAKQYIELFEKVVKTK